jgi:hypothetical protein
MSIVTKVLPDQNSPSRRGPNSSKKIPDKGLVFVTEDDVTEVYYEISLSKGTVTKHENAHTLGKGSEIPITESEIRRARSALISGNTYVRF